jgi:hypothetical protein
MKIELDRKGLEALIKGTEANYNVFNNSLVKKAGHDYSDQYGRTNWRSLDKLTDDEVYRLYLICKNSWT